MPLFKCSWPEHGSGSWEDHLDRQLLEHLVVGQLQQAERDQAMAATLQNVVDALAKLDTDVQTEATDVTSKLAELITDIQAGIDAGGATAADLQGLLDHANAIDASVQAIDAAAVGATAPTAPTPPPAG